MKLSDMLCIELQKEVADNFDPYSYTKLRNVSDQTGIDLYSLEAFLNRKTVDDGLVLLSFIDKLFARYRHKIVAPIKSSKYNKLNSANKC